MQLVGPNGDQFRLRIVGYQFPSKVDDEYDSNWLRVEIQATVRGRSWQSIDACLLTWELTSLIDWIEHIAAGKNADREVRFLEPNLSFTLNQKQGDRVCFSVFFELESRPSWASAKGAPESDLWAELECSSRELQAWSAELREQLKKFPVRAGVSNSEGKKN